MNKDSSKYLFNSDIQLDSKTVEIEEDLEGFTKTSSSDINIQFLTLGKLRSYITIPKENQLSMESLKETKLVIIADEAHHLNSTTKKSKIEIESEQGWEIITKQILHAREDNILLEFTATMDMRNPNIQEKYQNKEISHYTLKCFNQDGYSKSISLLQWDTDDNNRALQALIFSQYRLKLLEPYTSTKPIILFKSLEKKLNTEFYEKFHLFLSNLTTNTVQQLMEQSSNPKIEECIKYLKDNKITYEDFTREIKSDFSEPHTILYHGDSKNTPAELEYIHNLESPKNPYRAIFIVNKLVEGWDVLNLFDIVILFEKKSKRETTSEAQLIGRGARYLPFIKDALEENKYKRQFDKDITNPLRFCEQLVYHSPQNNEFINKLNKQLIDDGYDTDHNSKTITIALKDSFLQTETYNKGVFFINSKVNLDTELWDTLPKEFIDKVYTPKIYTNKQEEQVVLGEKTQTGTQNDTSKKLMKISDLDTSIIRSALDNNSYYQFDNLKKSFNIKSIQEFISKYMSKVTIFIPKEIKRKEQEKSLRYILEDFKKDITKNKNIRGLNRFKAYPIKNTLKTITMNFSNSNEKQEKQTPQSFSSTYNLAINQAEWFAYEEHYGTDEEKSFVNFFGEVVYPEIQEKYENIYLIRNELLVKLRLFENGEGFYPDFILLLDEKDGSKKQYQVFIEPKNKDLATQEKEQSKEKFLKSLEETAKLSKEGIGNIDKYKLIGTSFIQKKMK